MSDLDVPGQACPYTRADPHLPDLGRALAFSVENEIELLINPCLCKTCMRKSSQKSMICGQIFRNEIANRKEHNAQCTCKCIVHLLDETTLEGLDPVTSDRKNTLTLAVEYFTRAPCALCEGQACRPRA